MTPCGTTIDDDMALRIGIDARMIGPVQTGLGRYALGLARHLPPLDPDNRYVIIRRARAPMPVATAPNTEDAVVEGDIDQPANLLAGPAINRLGLDLYHSLYDFVPPGLRVPRIVLTLHDMTWLEEPDLCFDERFAWVKARVTTMYAWLTMPYAARRAAEVITVSAHTRSRALALLPLDPARVQVVHHGVDRALFPAKGSGTVSPFGDDELRNRDQAAALAAPYFLSLGNTKPYKNTRAAIGGFARVAAGHPDCRLVVTGRSDSRANLERFARDLGIRDNVDFTGPVPHERLLDLLHGATALIFPSLVEGFGFPLIEAMSAGCPIVGSSAPTVAEICGDAALLPDPRSHAEVGDAMRTVLEDTALRQDLRARGFARAGDFTWDACARKTLAVYRKALGKTRE